MGACTKEFLLLTIARISTCHNRTRLYSHKRIVSLYPMLLSINLVVPILLWLAHFMVGSFVLIVLLLGLLVCATYMYHGTSAWNWHLCLNALLLRSGRRDYVYSNMQSCLECECLMQAFYWDWCGFFKCTYLITLFYKKRVILHTTCHFMSNFAIFFYYLLRWRSKAAHLPGEKACPLIP